MILKNENTHNAYLISNLIQSVKKYYPIELSLSNNDYEGYSALIKIVENKIEQIINNDLPSYFYKFVGDINVYFKGFKIIDECHKQFPNYSFSIKLSDKTSNYIHSNSILVIKLSLLANYFTVFYEEINTFEKFSKFKYKYQPLVYRIYSSNNNVIDPEKAHFDKVIKLIQEYFPSYVFVEHSILFNAKVSNGNPYNQKANKNSTPFSIYDFLFDNEYTWGNLEIAF